ncbi:hypothetical protein GOV11_00170 [Candidatus Woesearchaeota archaeon]|nr:hypothetical protein [Candidatus Woesearchaeota archaeon]
MVGRKGEESLVLETIISLAFFMLFGVTAFLFISGNANSEGFFSKFLAAETSTIAELANAGQGDVTLTYDNIKKKHEYRFQLYDGKVEVGPDADVKTWIPFNTRYYGKSGDYRRELVLHNPKFLIFKTVGDSFAIMDAMYSISDCPHVSTKLVTVNEAKIFLKLEGDVTASERDQIKKEFKKMVDIINLPLAKSEDEATILIELHRRTGSNSLAIAPTTEDGRSIACLFHRELQERSNEEFKLNTPSRTSAKRIEIRMTLSTDSQTQLTANQIGISLGVAIGRYY